MPKSVPAKWLRLSEESNAIDYLAKIYEFLDAVKDDRIRNRVTWKWVIIALHGAIYGFAVCSATGSSSEPLVKTTKKGKNFLVPFDEVIKLCKKDRGLALEQSEEDALTRLKDIYRNQLQHYVPLEWSIEIHDFPVVTMEGLSIIRKLYDKSSMYSHFSTHQHRKIKSFLHRSERLIEEMRLYQELIEANKARNNSQPYRKGKGINP